VDYLVANLESYILIAHCMNTLSML
jgi:hypothetical protein